MAEGCCAHILMFFSGSIGKESVSSMGDRMLAVLNRYFNVFFVVLLLLQIFLEIFTIILAMS